MKYGHKTYGMSVTWMGDQDNDRFIDTTFNSWVRFGYYTLGVAYQTIKMISAVVDNFYQRSPVFEAIYRNGRSA